MDYSAQKLKITSSGVIKMKEMSGALILMIVESQKTQSIRFGLLFVCLFFKSC